MKTFLIASLAVVLSANAALAGDLAVSKSTLDTMGLGGMHQLTDHDGLAIRGKGPFPTGTGPRGPGFGGPSHGFTFEFPEFGGFPGGFPGGGFPGGGDPPGNDPPDGMGGFGFGNFSDLFGGMLGGMGLNL